MRSRSPASFAHRFWRSAAPGENDDAQGIALSRPDGPCPSTIGTRMRLLCTVPSTPIQQDAGAGSIRVNVRDRETGRYVPKVHVKAIGSSDTDFRAGDTDLRGIFATNGLNGLPTVIARAEDSRYAFYRSERSLGNADAQPQQRGQSQAPAAQQLELNDYLENSIQLNDFNNGRQIQGWDSLRRSGKGGVQIKQAK